MILIYLSYPNSSMLVTFLLPANRKRRLKTRRAKERKTRMRKR